MNNLDRVRALVRKRSNPEKSMENAKLTRTLDIPQLLPGPLRQTGRGFSVQGLLTHPHSYLFGGRSPNKQEPPSSKVPQRSWEPKEISQASPKQAVPVVPTTPHSPLIAALSLPHPHPASWGGGAEAANETRPFLGSSKPQLLAQSGQSSCCYGCSGQLGISRGVVRKPH